MEQTQQGLIMETILFNMIEGVLVIDDQARVVLANHAASKLLLLKNEEIMGKAFFTLLDNQKINDMVCSVLRNGKEMFAETSLGLRSQTFRVHVAPIVVQPHSIEGAVIVFHDVTDARNFDQMRAEFVGNVSHELRTPLTSIKGFVETLLDGALEDSVLCRRFLNIIDSEADRLSRLIEDLLTLSSIESKERMIRMEPVCIVQSIRSVLSILAPQISDKHLQVEFIYQQELALIHADADLLNQVLINLLDNAVKYTPAGGEIIIRCYQHEGRVVTTIADTGMGIPREKLPRIFERFYRVDKARSRELGGKGLGLSIVKHIIDLHGGEVFVESKAGYGSTFGVSFIAL